MELIVLFVLVGAITYLTRYVMFAVLNVRLLSSSVTAYLRYVAPPLFSTLIVTRVITRTSNVEISDLAGLATAVGIAAITRSLPFTVIGSVVVVAVFRGLM